MIFSLNRKLSKDLLKRHKISKSFLLFVISFIFFFHYSLLNSDYIIKKTNKEDYVSYNLRSAKNADVSYNISSNEKPTKWKKILLWTPYFGKMEYWSKVFRRLRKNQCEENRCKILMNQKRFKEADAILFNANDLLKKEKSLFESPFLFPDPKLRRPDQIFVFFSFEPPANMHNIKLDSFINYFNWTMTYRRDSDIFIPYGRVFKKERGSGGSAPQVTVEELKKKKNALWMVSHCETQSKREVFARELQKYMEVDVFGLCGPYKCGDRTTIPKMINDGQNFDPCDKLISNYTFYLSLENSICTDYVTEKLFRALYRGSIPVVLGGANYSSFVPESSYINAKDFHTVEDLAKYMNKVSKSPELFNKYLEWSKDYSVDLGHPYSPLTCDLCKKLHSQDVEKTKYYENMKKWYVTGSECFSLSV